MTTQLPVYQDILNQAAAVEQAIAHQRGPGREALELAAAVIRQALERRQPVAVVGIGASYSGSLPFVRRFAAAGLPASLEDASEFLHFNWRAYAEPSVLLLVSRSGSTIEITRILELVHGRGHFIIGVTNVPDSPLAKQADVTLRIGGPNDNLIAIQTYLSTLLALDLLADAVIGTTQPDDRFTGLPAAIAETVERYRSISPSWRDKMRPFQAAYLLGRGPALASALEGALLFHEMARFPAVAVGAGAYRHGMWEVVDARLRCFVFAPPDATYDLNTSLAFDLAGLGADTTLITEQPPTRALPERLKIWPIPKTSPNFTPYLEIIPLQLYTYELALWQGLTPGVFRTSPQVILNESGTTSDEE